MVFLYNKLIKRFGRVDSLGSPRDSRGFSIFNGSIQFIDGCKMIPGMSLKDACRDFTTKVQKKDFPIDQYNTW